MQFVKKGSWVVLLLAVFFNMVLISEGAKKKMTQSKQQMAAMGEKIKKNPTVDIETSLGAIEVELYPDKAPTTVKNFLKYVNEKFYDGTIFHRVIPNFMIQGGGFTPDMKLKETHPAIQNEAGYELANNTGTIAMARTYEVNSASAQFFINTNNNAFLNHRDNTAQGYGYAVFGKVIKGMDVVRKIEQVHTGTAGQFQNVPNQPVVIKSIREKK